MRSGKVVYDNKTMEYGVVRKRLPDKTGVCLLDPITLEESCKTFEEDMRGWKPVPKDHLVQKWVDFFDIVEEADWYIDTPGEVGEHYIENRHAVFKQIRKLFEV